MGSEVVVPAGVGFASVISTEGAMLASVSRRVAIFVGWGGELFVGGALLSEFRPTSFSFSFFFIQSVMHMIVGVLDIVFNIDAIARGM